MSKPDSLIDGSESPPSAAAAGGGKTAAAGGASESGTQVLGPTYLFYVKIEGLIVGLFSECSGIGARRAVDTFKEGGVNDHAHVLPGRLEYTNITLKRGITTSRILWDWFQTGTIDFKVQRHTVTIIQAAPGKDNAHGIIKTWNLNRAFPVNWKLSDLNTGANSLAIETLELAHEGITLQ